MEQEAARSRAALRAFGEHLSIGVLPEGLGTTIDSMLAAVRRELDMPVAYLTTFTDTHQVVIRVDGDGTGAGIHQGLAVPLGDTYCIAMLRGHIPNLVVDTRREPVLAELGGTGSPIGAYLGVPVHLPNGHVIGTLCSLDTTPRPDLTTTAVGVLRAVAELVGSQLADLRAEIADRESLVARIHRVLSDPSRTRSAYQPIVDLVSGRVVGVEALTRFEDHRVRSPDLWFAEAESIGMGVRLEVATARRALAGIDELPEDCTMSVNLSPGALTPAVLEQLLADVPLERTVVEVTEHAAVEDYDAVNAALRPFRRRGLQLAIDDVGAGFANLRHVLRTAPDAIKLDRSLVAQLTTDRAQQAIVAAFARMAAELGALVVAEGVEDEPTRALLSTAGVERGQGWLFERARPLPLEALAYPVAAA